MPLRIAFDLDGVLADMEAELVRQAEILFGPAMTQRLLERGDSRPGESAVSQESGELVVAGVPADVPPLLRLNMTGRQQRRLWRHVEAIDNFWATLDETEPGIIRHLAAAARERRWEVIFLTKRPRSAGDTSQVQTQRWLAAKGFPLPSVFVVQGSRGRIAAALALDAVIDDRPENCLDVVSESLARAILVWRDDEKRLPVAARRLGIGVVPTVRECLDLLIQIDSSSQEPPRIVDRLLRLLGLGQSAGA